MNSSSHSPTQRGVGRTCPGATRQGQREFTMKAVSTGVLLVASVSLSAQGFAPEAPCWVRPTATRLSRHRHAAISFSTNRVSRHPPNERTAVGNLALPMAESSLQDNNSASIVTIVEEEGPLDYAEQNAIVWDRDTLLNNGLIVGTIALLVGKILTLDGDLSRGWTAVELLRRVPTDVWDAYSSVLAHSPISTKAVTSATVYTIGDVIAQRAEGKTMGQVDRLRTLRSMAAGLIGHGPLSHYWYNFSEDVFSHVLHWTAVWSVLPKVALDQLAWGPIWNNTYILLLGLMKFESLETVWADVKRTTIPLVVSGLKLWPLAHMVTYGLIPVENRLLWVDLVEILWVVILATQAAGGPEASSPLED